MGEHRGEHTYAITLRTVHRLTASWFGSGLILRRIRGSDAGSGTVGALVAWIMAWLIGPDRWAWQLAAAALVTILSVWSARPFAAEGDPGWIVVDEAAGTFVATLGLPLGPAALAFGVFRLADATKRAPGVAAAERLPGAVGITADDLVAGCYGLAAGWILNLLV